MATGKNPKTYHVFLGRFCPFHLGHQKTVDRLVREHGLGNILILIGSSNSYNSRTPYTYEDRKAMILSVYPGLLVSPLPDVLPSLIHFDGSTNDLWLASISRLEEQMQAHFIFYGGCPEDLAVLSEKFQTKILINRTQKGGGVSATQVRQALDTGDQQTLTHLLSPQVLPLARAGYLRYQNSL